MLKSSFFCKCWDIGVWFEALEKTPLFTGDESPHPSYDDDLKGLRTLMGLLLLNFSTVNFELKGEEVSWLSDPN